MNVVDVMSPSRTRPMVGDSVSKVRFRDYTSMCRFIETPNSLSRMAFSENILDLTLAEIPNFLGRAFPQLYKGSVVLSWPGHTVVATVRPVDVNRHCGK